MPFLTEELWHFCGTRTPNEALIISQWPKPAPYDKKLLDDFDQIQQLIGAVRKFRKEKNIGFKVAIQLHIINDKTPWNQYESLLKKMGLLKNSYTNHLLIRKWGELSVWEAPNFIPLEGRIDIDAERQKLEEELQYAQGFLQSVEKKLNNERFVNNAPEQVVDIEKKKAADAVLKIRVLKESLAKLMQ